MSMSVGIDLGTTNSAVAAFDGEAVIIVPNALGESLTPSVVRLDAAGAATVGRRALRLLERAPEDVRAEWKRLMGTDVRLRFEAADRSLAPEELSAHVLRSLLADARDALGFTPRAAVISTPALFELPQNHATARAGQLAGLEEVLLIQEPIASALAAGWRADAQGLWLVFDLGGGTLDVSLLETKEGRLRVVDHAGDNFLGGKDVDAALVDWAVGRLALPGLDRARPEARRPLAKLRAACEQAKIDLSRADQTVISVPELCADGSGRLVDVELPLTRRELEALAAPLVVRALAVVQGLLAARNVSADDVERIALVGGPTLMPAVRGPVAALFGGRIADGIDPMTIVARGAALYAASAGLDARPAPPRRPGAGLSVRVEHPPITSDAAPFVVGRFLPGAGDPLPDRVWIDREGGGFRSAEVQPSAEGSFVLQVELVPDRSNRFTLHAVDGAGGPIRLAGPELAIIHGISIADPPLSRAVAVACADDLIQVYFPKGTPLPARRTFVHHTARPVSAASGEDALAVPVVQGESNRAHRNRLIGVLSIRGVARDLPAGSRVEVTLHLDRSGRLAARADVPALGQTFEDVAHVLVPTASLETLEREREATLRRADDVQRRAFQSGLAAAAAAVGGVAGLLAEAAAAFPAARDGDADAVLKIQRLLLGANGALDDAEATLEWPEMERETRSCVLFFTPLVSQWGTPAEQRLYDQALEAVAEAQKRRDRGVLERQLEAVRSLGRASYCRNPESMTSELEWLANHVTQSVDVPRAQGLIERARAHVETPDRSGGRGPLRALLTELWDLFPSSPEEQCKSFGSGVR